MTDAFNIGLTWPEIRSATEVAMHRHLYDCSKKWKPKHGAPEDYFDGLVLSLRGCIGEIAVAKCLGQYWTGAGGFNLPDVGVGIEVRTISERGHRLIVHDDDPDEYLAVLTLVDNPQIVHLLGWIPCREAKSKEFLSDPCGGREAYFVPQRSLFPMNEIFKHLNKVEVA